MCSFIGTPFENFNHDDIFENLDFSDVNSIDTSVCSNCEAKNLVTDYKTGDLVCTQCGYVASGKLFDESIYQGPTSSVPNFDFFQNWPELILPNQVEKEKANLKLNNTQKKVNASNYQQLHLKNGLQSLSELASTFELPELVENKAKELFAMFEQRRPKRTHNSKALSLLSGVLFLSCKEVGYPKTFHFFASKLNISAQQIRRDYKKLREIIYNKISKSNTTIDFGSEESNQSSVDSNVVDSFEDLLSSQDFSELVVPLDDFPEEILDDSSSNLSSSDVINDSICCSNSVTPPNQLVEQICADLSLPFKLIQVCSYVATKAAIEFEGKRPSSLSATSCLFVIRESNLNLDISEKEVFETSGVSKNTLRSLYKLFVKNKQILLPSDWQ